MNIEEYKDCISSELCGAIYGASYSGDPRFYELFEKLLTYNLDREIINSGIFSAICFDQVDMFEKLYKKYTWTNEENTEFSCEAERTHQKDEFKKILQNKF